MTAFTPRNGWGPDGKRAALAITFDNLGEAAYIEMNMWGDAPVGQHYTAAFVPKLIETLGDFRATYFIEASNCAIYPDAIKQWAAAGNEVGIHAWRHEAWDRTSSDRRRDILIRSFAAMRSIGIEPVGFRPPGGALPQEAWAEFAEAGLLYASDLGKPGIERFGQTISLPFAWHNVDSYMIEDLTRPLRVMFGDPEEPYTLDEWQATLDRTIDEALAEGGQRTIIFHPEFIGASDEKLAVVSKLIERAKAEDMWIARARDIAAFVAAETSLVPAR
jgi:peptidoglycan/xylan/chitin deacetylase (PgdA/CDA1 family)